MCKQAGNRGKTHRLAGFTLVELLVVISIISMLMSILLPGLSQSRELGQRVHCMSNLRQLTMAWYFYAQDYEDKPCSPGTLWNDFWGSNYWVADGPDWPGNDIGNTEQAIEDGVLWPYTMKTLGLYKCKSDHTDFLRDYSLSGGVAAGLDNIPRPSRKMIFVDASSNWKWIHKSYWPVTCCDGKNKWLPWDCRHLQQITARHNGGCNMSFADFHCEYFRWKDPRTVKFANRQIPAEEASDNNPDIDRLLEVLK